MKLTVLTDNNTLIDLYYLGEPAVSYYIEDDDFRCLFDVGYSDVYVKNARALGLDLTHLNAVVISHGHNDHTGGLAFFPQAKVKCRLIAHPGAFEPKRAGGLDISSPLTLKTLKERFAVTLSAKPIELTKHLVFLGEIPRTNNFENQKPIGEKLLTSTWQADYVQDDSALVYKSKNGLCIITGCSHAGICNIVEYAKKVTGDNRVHAVIGGFHLFDAASAQMQQTIAYFKQYPKLQLYPCHCTSFAAKAALHQVIPIHEVGVSLSLVF